MPAKPTRKPKHHPGQIRTTVSLSFSLPAELEQPMNELAAQRGMSRSQYIVWLFRQHLYLERGQLPPLPQGEQLPALPLVPPRIRRKQREQS